MTTLATKQAYQNDQLLAMLESRNTYSQEERKNPHYTATFLPKSVGAKDQYALRDDHAYHD